MALPRLTKRDWKTINDALAYYEAQPLADEFGFSEEEDEEVTDAIASAREKVWARTERWENEG